MTRIKECLQGSNGNYILPFFWQHGESEEVLRTYMNAIYNANIKEVCLEARPHPDYAGEQWFHDVDIILDEAKKLGMKIWILDDAHFPSGQCAGKLAEEPAEFQKQYLKYSAADVAGPVKGAVLKVDVMAREYPNPFAPKSMFDQGEKKWYDDDHMMAVIASKLDGKEGSMYHLDETLLDLTDQVKDGVLAWDVPNGTWRIFVLYTTRNNGGRGGYVNFMSKESCRKQIEYCYEPHYERYKDEFGKTILGFFSDEPEIGNVSGYDASNSTIGNMQMPIPWSEEMPALMEERFGKDYLRKAVALWMPVGSDAFTADVRVGYMDIMTRQCQKNFAEQLGEWCRERGVEYIGHVVEDNDQHTKLGASQGHFFRALWGQDWSGIDNIGGQVTIGGANVSHRGLIGIGGNGEFYHQVLGKLGTSLADLDPKKKGRSMCEIFGAYGWEEGTRLMKYEMDHYLVRGINHYVPHAFSPKEFPDLDCPPHFYAHGKNPLYKPFGTLMSYSNRICHLISGGKHEVQVAVLYHAESQWAGTEYMDMVRPARVLNEHQIDFDFIPADVFSDPADFEASFDGKELKAGQCAFKALVVPGAAYVPECVMEFAAKAKESGFPVYFIGRLPEGYEGFDVIELENLAETLVQDGAADAVSDTVFPDLQVYHYSHEDETYYLISNESAGEIYKGTISLPVRGIPYLYDAFKNVVNPAEYEENERGIDLPMTIEPYEMMVIVVPKNADAYKDAAALPVYGTEKTEVTGPWKVSFTENENYPDFTDEMTMDVIENILHVKPYFSGVVRYEASFTASEGAHELELENAYESAEVWVNGEYAGERICPPYRFDLTGLCREGENTLRIEVRTTLERKVYQMMGGKGMFGAPMMSVVTPSGIVGKVTVK